MSETTGEGPMHVIYVSPEGDDRWSGRLAEANADRSDGPMASVEGVIRSLWQGGKGKKGGMARAGLRGPVAVRMRGGVYRVSEPITIPGGFSWPIMIEPYGDEQPILDGGEPIEGWVETTLNGMAVWAADVPVVQGEPRYFRQLFVNGEPASRPKAHWEPTARVAAIPGATPGNWGTPGSDYFQAAAGDFIAKRNLGDVEVVALHFWIEERLPVVSYDPESRIVRLSRVSRCALMKSDTEGARYYLDNVYEAFGEPGQWYLDREAGKVYYIPREGETLAGSEMIAARARRLLVFSGDAASGATVEHVRFRGITFRHTDWALPHTPGDEETFVHKQGRGNKGSNGQGSADVPGAIYMTGARYCAIEDCVIEDIGWYAVEVERGCVGCRVVGNTMRKLGAGGVKLNGSTPLRSPAWNTMPGPLADRNRDNRVTDNHIHDAGHVFHSAVGVLARHVNGVVIAHNEIDHLYYSGISVGWTWGYADTTTGDNRIEKNHIHHLGMGRLSDMGGVYTLGVQPGTVIRGNHIHDIEKDEYGGWAIYPDEGSSHLIIENNLCHDTNAQAFHQHYGRENIVRNNLFAFAGEGLVALSRNDGFAAFSFYRNIVIADAQPIYVGGYNATVGDYPVDCFDNLFWDVGGTVKLAGPRHDKGGEELDDATLAGWQALGHDRHSLVADPKCGDVAKRDFALAADSPAVRELGFKPLDMSDVGPRPAGARD